MKPWQTAAWKKRRAELIKGKSCSRCGSTEKLAIHHPQKKYALTDEEYLSLEGTIILCHRCHFITHMNKGIIPVNAKGEWIKLGYVENDRCYKPGGLKARERVKKGLCSWTATTCAGKIRVCEWCGIPYCEYHFRKHQR